MSRTAERRKRKRRTAPKPKVVQPMSDRAVYIALGIIGLFTIILIWMVTVDVGPAGWRLGVVGYLALVAYLINFYSFQVLRGQHLTGWQQSLARVPLRFAGYGTKDGKPLEAAHDRPETKNALLVSVIVSLLIVGAVAALLLPSAFR